MSEKPVSLDVTNISNFRYDMSHCVRCKGCKWVDHIYMPGREFATRCPSEKRYLFDSYAAYGRLKLGLDLQNDAIQYSPHLVDALYRCQLCGACDVGCKRNLDLEIHLSLEALRMKAVKDGVGPMPEHKRMADNVRREGNIFSAPQKNRQGFLPPSIEPSIKADIAYFVGCLSSYTSKEIAQATVKILKAAGTPFMLLADEWCCGNPLYLTGLWDESKRVAEHNIEAIKNSGAGTVLTSCAECYRMIKVDYPKLLNISTSDLGFKVVHLVEYVTEGIKEGAIRPSKRVELSATYHDSCSLSRLSEPWLPWKGERGHWGLINPPLQRRRGTHGIYHQPRDILKGIPGLELQEMVRIRENAWCCGAGGGVREAFKDFALWTAEERLEEVREIGAEAIVSTCPRCKENFSEAIKKSDDRIRVYDIAELISEAIV